jgi:hypothetical protein
LPPVQLARRGAQAPARLDEVPDTVAALDIGDRVLPALAGQTATAPPASSPGLNAKPIAATAKRAGTGVLTAACAGDPAQWSVATNQLEKIDVLFDDRCIDWHAPSLTRAI